MGDLPWILRGLSAEVTQTALWLTPNQLSIVDLTPSPLSSDLRMRRPGRDTIDSITLKTRVCRTRLLTASLGSGLRDLVEIVRKKRDPTIDDLLGVPELSVTFRQPDATARFRVIDRREQFAAH